MPVLYILCCNAFHCIVLCCVLRLPHILKWRTIVTAHCTLDVMSSLSLFGACRNLYIHKKCGNLSQHCLKRRKKKTTKINHFYERFRCDSLYVCSSYCGASPTAAAATHSSKFLLHASTTQSNVVPFKCSIFLQTIVCDELKTLKRNINSTTMSKQQPKTEMCEKKQIRNSDAHYNVCFDIMT